MLYKEEKYGEKNIDTPFHRRGGNNSDVQCSRIIHLFTHMFGNQFTKGFTYRTYPEIKLYRQLVWKQRCPDK